MELDDIKQQKIHVKIGNFRLPLNVLSEQEEEIYRKAEKLANRYFDEYQRIYPFRSEAEILTISALRLAAVVYKMELDEDIEPLATFIQGLDNELKELLDEK